MRTIPVYVISDITEGGILTPINRLNHCCSIGYNKMPGSSDSLLYKPLLVTNNEFIQLAIIVWREN